MTISEMKKMKQKALPNFSQVTSGSAGKQTQTVHLQRPHY